MIRHAMTYFAPETMPELLERIGNAKDRAAVLGGGTWLIPNMTQGISRPSTVVDLRRLGLDRISEESDRVVIGARVTYDQIRSSELIQRRIPLLAHMAAQITGGRAITSQATLAGSACYASPSSDAPATLVCLEGIFRLRSRTETRDVSAQEFFVDAFKTSRRDDEVLTEIRLPFSPSNGRFGYEKLKLATGSWPIVTAAYVAGSSDAGSRLAVGGAGAKPVLLAPLHYSPGSAGTALEIGRAAAALIKKGWSDELADGNYRLKALPAVVQSALLHASGGPAR